MNNINSSLHFPNSINKIMPKLRRFIYDILTFGIQIPKLVIATFMGRLFYIVNAISFAVFSKKPYIVYVRSHFIGILRVN